MSVPMTLSPDAVRSMTVNTLRRRIAGLRQACSDYEAETARIVQKVERGAPVADAPRLRLAADLERSPGFKALRDALRQAEEALAIWKPKARKPPKASGFGASVSKAIARATQTAEGVA